jgi:sensor domain CHASE-containing protein
MCTQEFTYRRNANYVESLRQKVLHHSNLLCIANQPKRTLEEIEDSIPDESDGQHFEVIEPSSSPTSSLDSNHEEKGAMLVHVILILYFSQANVIDRLLVVLMRERLQT